MITLFDYQEDMAKRVQEALRHHDSVMAQMGTLRIKDGYLRLIDS